jgi:pyruvate, water dikinase
VEQLYWLDRIQPSQAALVGEKALALSQLAQLGYPIVPGFVIPTPKLREFLETLGELEPLLADLSDSSLYVDVDDPDALQSVARRVREGITATKLPRGWLSEIIAATRQWPSSAFIVRPSLALPPGCEQNFAGLLRSRVCTNQPESLELALKGVWTELFRASSLFCLAKAALSVEAINLALLVQPIQDAIASGTMEIREQQAHILAVWGLGHSWVLGKVQPDYYRGPLSPLSPPDPSAAERPSSSFAPRGGESSQESRQLGNQTLVYRVQGPDPASLQQETPGATLAENLHVELLKEEAQQKFCLDEAASRELIGLARALVAERPKICYLEWTFVRDRDRPKFYFTQSSPYYRTIAPIVNHVARSFQEVNPSIPLLRGLPAAPGRAIAPVHALANLSPPDPIPPGRILVAKAITPEWLPWLEGAAGIVTEQGGITSHAAIIARELGIPAIVGVREATTELKTGTMLAIDGTLGEIDRQAVPQESIPPSLPSISNSPLATQLFLNLSQSSSLARVAALPVDGVGLLRSELTIVALLEAKPLSWWLQDAQKDLFVNRLTEQILQFAQHFAPRTVFYRSTDWRSPEFSPHFAASPRENNPILGRRGTFSYTLDPTLFEAELSAIARVQASGYNNINLLLPFVRCVEEFSFCRDRVRQFAIDKYPNFQLWIMAEVPSVYFLLPEYVKAGVQGISIGTNDLTQLLLGVDREQAELAQLFDERHPAILSVIQQLIERARDMGIPCSICGQAPVLYPEIIDRLVQWGITAISVEAGAVEQTYWAIARAEQRLLLEAARRRQ